MTIFEAVKAQVTPRMAAERYGLRVSRSGMVRCLFHDDATPSMKLYDDHYHCFGCQATGDVIHLTAKLFGVTDQEAARKHMVKKYPELERGESAGETGRTHIPPRLFKEAVHLARMKEQILQLHAETNPLNKKGKAEELENLLERYIPAAEAMRTKLKKYDGLYRQLSEEKAALEKKLASASGESIRKKLEINQKLRELEELRHTVEMLPPEILQAAKRHGPYKGQER